MLIIFVIIMEKREIKEIMILKTVQKLLVELLQVKSIYKGNNEHHGCPYKHFD